MLEKPSRIFWLKTILVLGSWSFFPIVDNGATLLVKTKKIDPRLSPHSCKMRLQPQRLYPRLFFSRLDGPVPIFHSPNLSNSLARATSKELVGMRLLRKNKTALMKKLCQPFTKTLMGREGGGDMWWTLLNAFRKNWEVQHEEKTNKKPIFSDFGETKNMIPRRWWVASLFSGASFDSYRKKPASVSVGILPVFSGPGFHSNYEKFDARRVLPRSPAPGWQQPSKDFRSIKPWTTARRVECLSLNLKKKRFLDYYDFYQATMRYLMSEESSLLVQFGLIREKSWFKKIYFSRYG